MLSWVFLRNFLSKLYKTKYHRIMAMLHLTRSLLRHVGGPSQHLQIKSALKRLMNSIRGFGSTLTLTKIDSASFFPQTEGGFSNCY